MSPFDDATLDHLQGVLRESTTAEPSAAHSFAFPMRPCELLEEIGRGGMGVVNRARDLVLGRDVALKVIAPGGASADLAARLGREARILAQLEHPGIVPVHDVGVLADGRAYAAMKLVRGEPLSSWLAARGAERPGRAGERELAERLRLLLKVLETVAFAHARGVLHCDLKPGNTMVGSFGEVLVLDWGLARHHGSPAEAAEAAAESTAPAERAPAGAAGVRHATGATVSGAVLGTPGYMAPEQERGERTALDGRTDVFALGAILGELTAGAAPPAAVLSIARRAQALLPAERYPNVEAMAGDVARFLARQPVSAHRERPGEVLRRWYARYEAPILLVVAYLLLRILFWVWPR